MNKLISLMTSVTLQSKLAKVSTVRSLNPTINVKPLMIKSKSLFIIQASNPGCNPWEHRPVLLGRQVGKLWVLTSFFYPHSFPQFHPHLWSRAPAAVSPHTHLTSPPVYHTALKTSLLPFILAPNSSKWSLGMHRPLMPVKRIGQLQIFKPCSYPLN